MIDELYENDSELGKTNESIPINSYELNNVPTWFQQKADTNFCEEEIERTGKLNYVAFH